MVNDYGLVFDVEATCDANNRIHRGAMEVIEIGAVLVKANFAPVAEYGGCLVGIVGNVRLQPAGPGRAPAPLREPIAHAAPQSERSIR